MPLPVMAFQHPDGLVPTWRQASKYAGTDGRIATLPDIIDARLATEPGKLPWERYFTTTSAEYIGYSKRGTQLLVVTHGVGSMASLDGIMETYKHEYADKSRNKRGGRISTQEFWRLLDGHYGEIFVVDLKGYMKRYRYPFLSILKASELLDDPVFHARVGGEQRAHRYIDLHALHAGLDLKTNDDKRDPYIVKVGDASNCMYEHRSKPGDLPLAHVLSMSQLVHTHHDRWVSLSCDIYSHEWGNGCRFVAIPPGAGLTCIHPGWNAGTVLEKHWQQLMAPNDRRTPMTMRPLMQFAGQWFTMYQTRGHNLQTWEPEFLVTKLEPVGEPTRFETHIEGYYGFFRYDVQEVRPLAPSGANAFVMNEPTISYRQDGEMYHTAPVQFYRAEADVSRRLTRKKDLANDYDTMGRLEPVVA